MDYIHRDIEAKIRALSREYACLLLTGPRHVGKSTVLEHLMTENRVKVTLDDMSERALAKRDPAMFLQAHGTPILVEEVQYAPELFPYIKMAVDNGAAAGSFWLTCSQIFQMMDPAQESLAGRTAVLQMTALSQHEISGSGDNVPFSVSLPDITERQSTHAAADPREMYARIWNGGMPGHVSGKYNDWDAFYSHYVSAFIDRDVSGEICGVDRLLFWDFLCAAACRAGKTLNVHDIAGDTGVTDMTAKSWLDVLEKSGIIFYLRPYNDNLLRGAIKKPRMYFFDTGLVAYLTRHTSPDILMNGAIRGALLENYAAAELRKSWLNDGKDCPLWYYRDKDGREIHMILESDGQLHPMEVKHTVNPGRESTCAFRVLDKGPVPRGRGAVLCLGPELSSIDGDDLVVPVWML